MLRKILFTVILGSSLSTLLAQTGTIKGTVKDGTTAEGVIGANVYIAGTTQGSAADINGNFEITRIKAGTYDFVVSFISYKTDTLKNITIYPDQTTVVNTTLFEESQQLQDVVVTGAKVTNTDVSVITEIKKADLVMVGISAQQISLSQDRDASQIMKRIPGVTITNNRFVNVRGLSERYSTVLLNGIIAPSTEVDSKAFAFDLIPSTMIDRMMVYKSGSAELPGEFAGAIINISTKSVVDENSLSVNLTTGIRLGTTFKSFNTYTGSSTDWLGFDNGTRQLPSTFPTENLRSLQPNDPKIEAATFSLPNNWQTNNQKAAPDLRATINFARAVHFGNKKLSNITSISYSAARQHLNQDNYYYNAFSTDLQTSDMRYYFKDNRDLTNIRVGIISNFIFELNPKNSIEFRNLFNQLGTSQVTSRTGVEITNGEQDVNNLSLNYQSRGIYAGQLSGKHGLSDRLNVNWTLAYSSTKADQPDYRRIRSQRANANDPYSIVIPSQASALDAGRFYSDLSERTYTHALNLDYKVNPNADEAKIIKISAGYYLAKTERDFSARFFSYKQNSLSNGIPNEVLTVPFHQIFVPGNLGFYQGVSGSAPYFILDEGTNLSDAYKGNNLLTAGYASTVIPFANKFRLAMGARVEYNRQQINSFDSNGKQVNVDNPITSVLPFANLSYSFNETSLVRLAYSKTVNRPVFRELAPFNFYDFDRNVNVFGNPSLQIANIQNIDLRWEMYPAKGENISVGVFYKQFDKPIEVRLESGSNLIYSYNNAQSAYNYGAEIEARKSLEGLVSSSFLNKISFVINAAIIKSEIDLGNVTNQDRKRAMQGQSPYVLNTGLFYSNYDNGLQVNVSYNVFGKRIFAVGDLSQNATQYEMPRNQIDLTISKDFGKHFEIKAGVQDILNQRYRIVQDSNRDGSISSVDEPININKPGQYISFGVTYKL